MRSVIGDVTLRSDVRPTGISVRTATASRFASVGRHPVVTAGFVAVVSALAAWLRLPGVARDTLWAEDGRNFLQAALDQGPLASLFIPYAGYLHTIPRIVASFTVQVMPLQLYAQAMTAAACAAAGIVAAIVYVCSADVIRWMPGRLVVSLLTVLAPLAPREVLGNQANLHSLIFWGLFWLLLHRPRTRWGSYGLAGAALFGSLTEIQALLLLPLLVWHPRDRARWGPRFGYLVGVGTQLVVTLLLPRAPSGNPPVDPASMVFGFFINCVVPIWIPLRSIGPAMVWGGIGLCLVLSLPFLAAFVFSVWRGSAIQRVAAFGLLGGAAVVYCAGVIENPWSSYNYAALSTHDLNSLWLSRYGVVPGMMLCALIPVALAVVVARLPSGDQSGAVARRIAASSGLGIIVVLLLVQFSPQATVRSGGPAWQPQLAALNEICHNLPDASTVQVQETIGWHVDVPCALFE